MLQGVFMSGIFFILFNCCSIHPMAYAGFVARMLCLMWQNFPVALFLTSASLIADLNSASLRFVSGADSYKISVSSNSSKTSSISSE